MQKIGKIEIIKVAIIVAIFWISDFILHSIGIGESKFYFISKFFNSTLFAILWVFVFYSKKSFSKLIYSFVFSTWVSFYYIISSYSGLVQYLGIYALSSPPPFVIIGLTLTPLIWWITHGLGFYIGLEINELIKKK